MATLTGKTGGDRGREAALKDGSPCGVGGVPAVPGPRCVPGPPGFPARGASGRVAATPPSPSERSAAAGPNYRFHQGEAARCGSWRRLGPARSLSVAAARPGTGRTRRPTAVPGRAAAPQPPGLALGPPTRTPSSTSGGTVCRASGRAQGPGPSTQPREGGGREPCRGWGHLPRGRSEGTGLRLRTHFLPADRLSNSG